MFRSGNSRGFRDLPRAVLYAVGMMLILYVALAPKIVMRTLDGLQVLNREHFHEHRVSSSSSPTF